MQKNTKDFPTNKNKQKPLNNTKARKSLTSDYEIKDKGISFSFRYFKQIENFGISGKDSTWTSGLLQQLGILSEKSADDLLKDTQVKNALRMHELKFEAGKTALTKADFNHIPKAYRPTNEEDCKILQFQISKATGRVIGFFGIDHTVFYIVFLEPNHNAQLSNYSDYKIREISPCASELDDLRARISKHALLNEALHSDSKEFLYEGDYAYLCIDKELVETFIDMVGDGNFLNKFREFLMNTL